MNNQPNIQLLIYCLYYMLIWVHSIDLFKTLLMVILNVYMHLLLTIVVLYFVYQNIQCQTMKLYAMFFNVCVL